MSAGLTNDSLPFSPAEKDGLPGPEASPARMHPSQWLVFAWIVSVAAHVVLFSTMFAIPWLARQVGRGEELVVAETELVGPAEATATRTTLVEPQPDFGEAEHSELPPVRFAPKRSQASTAGVGMGGDAGPERRGLSIIGLGTGGSDFSKYGLGVGTGQGGPQFFGLGGSARGARNIVYVVDRSGSMTGTFGAVRKELMRSVEGLRRSLRFHVIFFNAGPPVENPPRQLVHASREEKTRLAEFLAGVEPQGNTEPIPAMRRAFDVGPQVIYFLTDGEFDAQLIEELRKWNSKKQVRIFTIAYVSQRGGALLEQIARENNGEYRFVSEHDL